MGTVDNRVDKFRDNFGDTTYAQNPTPYPALIQGGTPQGKLRISGRLNEKVGNLQTYGYY